VTARMRSGPILAASVVAILGACAWEAWLMRLQYGVMGSLDGLFVRSLVLALGSVVCVALPSGMLVGVRSARHAEIGYGQLALEFVTLTMLVTAIACWRGLIGPQWSRLRAPLNESTGSSLRRSWRRSDYCRRSVTSYCAMTT
jgi:hypothetical protein